MSPITRFLIVRTIGLVVGGVLAAAISFALVAFCKILLARWITGTSAPLDGQAIILLLSVGTGMTTAIIPRLRVLLIGTLACSLATLAIVLLLEPPPVGNASPIAWWLAALLPIAAAALGPYQRLRGMRFDVTSTNVWLAAPLPAESRGGRVFRDE